MSGIWYSGMKSPISHRFTLSRMGYRHQILPGTAIPWALDWTRWANFLAIPLVFYRWGYAKDRIQCGQHFGDTYKIANPITLEMLENTLGGSGIPFWSPTSNKWIQAWMDHMCRCINVAVSRPTTIWVALSKYKKAFGEWTNGWEKLCLKDWTLIQFRLFRELFLWGIWTLVEKICTKTGHLVRMLHLEQILTHWKLSIILYSILTLKVDCLLMRPNLTLQLESLNRVLT